MAGWRLPSSPASGSLMRPHTQRGRKGVTTMPPACVVSLPFCPKELIHVAAVTPDNQKVKFSKGGVLILEGVPPPAKHPPPCSGRSEVVGLCLENTAPRKLSDLNTTCKPSAFHALQT